MRWSTVLLQVAILAVFICDILCHKDAVDDGSDPDVVHERAHLYQQQSGDGKNFRIRKNVDLGRAPRVYVYDLPARYNVALLDSNVFPHEQLPNMALNTSCRDFTEGVEIYLHEALLNSSYVVKNPVEADYFFIPVYSFCAYTRYDPWKDFTEASKHATAFLQGLFDHLDQEPRYRDDTLNRVSFLRRHGAADHIMVFPASHGASYFTLSSADPWSGVMFQMIGLNMFGEVADIKNAPLTYARMNPLRDIVIPAPVSHAVHDHINISGGIERFLLAAKKKERNGRAFFAGTRTSDVRARIADSHESNPSFDIQMRPLQAREYLESMLKSTFCLVPRGHSGWTMRLFDSIVCGCIPIIISDNQMLPFGDTLLDWSEFSVKIPEDEAERIGHVIKALPDKIVESMQHRLLEVAPLMWYHSPPGTNGHDAIWAIMHQLNLRRQLYGGHGRKFWGFPV